MYKIINLDMDGVLADFNGKMKELTGKVFEEYGVSSEAWTALRHYKENIYMDLNVLEGADKLVKTVLEIADEEGYLVSILTGIPKRNVIPKAEEHKRNWIKQHFPELYERFKLGPHSEDKWKHCFSNNDILIDDYWKNTQQWIGVGGYAILYRNVDQGLEELKKIVYKL